MHLELNTTHCGLVGSVLVKWNRCWLLVGSRNSSLQWKQPQPPLYSKTLPNFLFCFQFTSVITATTSRGLCCFYINKCSLGGFLETTAALGRTVSDICTDSTGHINTWKCTKCTWRHTQYSSLLFVCLFVFNKISKINGIIYTSPNSAVKLDYSGLIIHSAHEVSMHQTLTGSD